MALAVFTVVTVDVLVGGPLSALDEALSRWVRTTGLPGRGWNRPWHHELDQLVNFGDHEVVAVIAVIVLAAVCREARTLLPLLRLAVLGGLTVVTVWGLKVAVARPAPTGVAVEDVLRSYPSGHTATAVVLWGLIAAVVAEYRPRSVSAPVAEVLSWLGPLLTMTGLLLRDYHWLSDLIAGASVGVVLLQVERLALAHWRGGRRGSRRGAGAVRPPRPTAGAPPPVVSPAGVDAAPGGSAGVPAPDAAAARPGGG